MHFQDCFELTPKGRHRLEAVEIVVGEGGVAGDDEEEAPGDEGEGAAGDDGRGSGRRRWRRSLVTTGGGSSEAGKRGRWANWRKPKGPFVFGIMLLVGSEPTQFSGSEPTQFLFSCKVGLNPVSCLIGG